jgi:hypothetical protein
MQIAYASKTIQRLCEEDKHQRKQLGEKRAKRLKNRLGELRAVENVSQLRLGRPHALTADRAGQAQGVRRIGQGLERGIGAGHFRDRGDVGAGWRVGLTGSAGRQARCDEQREPAGCEAFHD